MDATFEVRTPVKLSGLHPHMHGRGKDFEYRVVYPDGESRVLLSVPHYNWHWQNWYNLRSADFAAEGREDRVHRPLRQFAE